MLYGSVGRVGVRGLVGGFSPASLFASGEQGVWYDPSNFSTMFQDSAGTTPVTAVEQPVGRILDLSGNNNHATQSTPAARPVLSARVNLLTRTEEFNDAVWQKRAGSITATTITAPNGTSTADTFSEDNTTTTHDFFNAASVAVSAGQYIARIYVRPRGRNIVRFTVAIAGVSLGATFNLSTGAVMQLTAGYAASATLDPSGFWLLQLTVTFAASNVFFGVQSSDGTTIGIAGLNGPAWDLWGGDLRPTNQTTLLPAYQRIAAATDYDTTGFPYYLRFDGTDDSMATGTITPGIDKAQVFAGVRKQIDAVSVPLEFSANSNSNNGSFALVAPAANGVPDFQFSLRGSQSTDYRTAASYPAPTTRVISTLFDISNAQRVGAVIPRINGVVDQTITGGNINAGTGNFLAYPLYIGSRAGSSFPFNGNLYSLIVRFGANLDATTINNTETYVNSKTLAY